MAFMRNARGHAACRKICDQNFCHIVLLAAARRRSYTLMIPRAHRNVKYLFFIDIYARRAYCAPHDDVSGRASGAAGRCVIPERMYAADAFAVDCGYGANLYTALDALDGVKAKSNFFSLLASTHPDMVDRLAAIRTRLEGKA